MCRVAFPPNGSLKGCQRTRFRRTTDLRVDLEHYNINSYCAMLRPWKTSATDRSETRQSHGYLHVERPCLLPTRLMHDSRFTMFHDQNGLNYLTALNLNFDARVYDGHLKVAIRSIFALKLPQSRHLQSTTTSLACFLWWVISIRLARGNGTL